MCIQPPLQSPPKIRFSTSVNYHLPISLLLVHKIIHTNPINTTFLYTSAIFHLPIFAHNHPSNLYQIYFPYLSHLANLGCVIGTRELESPVMTDTLWISPSFLKVWTVIIRITITDSLLLRLRKLGSSLWWRCLPSEWETIQSIFPHNLNLLSLFPYLTNTITRTQILLETSCLTWFSS